MESHESNCRLCKQCTAGVGVWAGSGISTTLIHSLRPGLHLSMTGKVTHSQEMKDLILHPCSLLLSREYLQNAGMNVKPPDEGKMYFYSIPFLHLRKQQCYVSSSSVNFILKSENMPEGLPSKLTLKKIFSYLWKPQEEPRGKRRFLRIIQIIIS